MALDAEEFMAKWIDALEDADVILEDAPALFIKQGDEVVMNVLDVDVQVDPMTKLITVFIVGEEW